MEERKDRGVKGKKALYYNIGFLAVAAAILIFLLQAPPETTAKLPLDEVHERFQTMKKKEAEAFCDECHGAKGQVPLPEGHPPKYRCLFCHKQQPR